MLFSDLLHLGGSREQTLSSRESAEPWQARLASLQALQSGLGPPHGQLIASESALPIAISLVERAWELKDRLYQPFLPLAAQSRTPQPNHSCNT